MPEKSVHSAESYRMPSGSITAAAASRLSAPAKAPHLVEPILLPVHSIVPATNPAILFGPPRDASRQRVAERTHKFSVRAARNVTPRLACENEDAVITGMTRSLHRRVLALYLPETISVAPVPMSIQAPLPSAAITLPSRSTAIARISRRTA